MQPPSKTTRNYDDKPLEISDSSDINHLYMGMAYILLYIIAYRASYGCPENGCFVYNALDGIFFFGYTLYAWYKIRKFNNKTKQRFVLLQNELHYFGDGFGAKKRVSEIQTVSYVFVTATYATSGSNIFANKSLFEVNIFEAIYYFNSRIIMAVSYLFLILPYRIIFQKCLGVLFKNFLITFEDGSFYNITVNNMSEYRQLRIYFSHLNITVKDEITFIKMAFLNSSNLRYRSEF